MHAAAPHLRVGSGLGDSGRGSQHKVGHRVELLCAGMKEQVDIVLHVLDYLAVNQALANDFSIKQKGVRSQGEVLYVHLAVLTGWI